MRDVPESLRARIMEVVAGSGEWGVRLPTPHPPLPSLLRQLANTLLETAKSAPPSRDTALTLLAADALITWACEAAAEVNPSSLREMW